MTEVLSISMILSRIVVFYGLLVIAAALSQRRTVVFDDGDNVFGDDNDAWKLCTNEAPADQFLWPTVGNGHVATVVRSQRVFMNGLYSGGGIESRRARIPAFTSVRVGGQALDNANKSYCLHMDKGMYIETYTTGHWNLSVTWYAHRKIPSLLVNVISVRTDGAQDAFDVYVRVNQGAASEDIALQNGTSDLPNTRYVHGQIKVPETNDSGYTPVHIYHTIAPSYIRVPGHVTQNQHVAIMAAISPFRDKARLDYSNGLTHQAILEEQHVAAWRDIWSRGRLDVDSNPELSAASHSAQYYILSSMPVDQEPESDSDWPFIGLSPGDLAHGPRVEEYKGHVFWDQDTWMFPAVLALHADLGRTLVQTRTRTLDAALTMATQSGYKGAKYPWESAFTGFETCPGPAYSDYEIHVSGDVAMAARQYLMVTRDTHLLRHGRLREEILGIADFWKSRVVYNETRQLYEIRDVMPPDEWHSPVNNSAYTNSVAKNSLMLPKFALALLGETAPPEYEHTADRMYIPFDRERQYHPEFDGFDPQTTAVKQADVILMGFPLGMAMTEQQRRNDLHIYANVTSAGPAMTWSMFCIGWLEVGETERTEKAFYKQLLNKQQPFNVWSEYADGSGAKNFITGQGGFLQSLMFGYAGLRMHEDRITLHCRPLPDTSGLRIKGLDYLGNSIDVICGITQMSITLRKDAVPLELVLLKTTMRYKLVVNKTLTFDLQPVALMETGTTSPGTSRDFVRPVVMVTIVITLLILVA